MKKKKISLDDFKLESFLTTPDPDFLKALRADGEDATSLSGPIICTIVYTLTPTPAGQTSDMGMTCKTARLQCPPPVTPTRLTLCPTTILCPPPICPTIPYLSCGK